MHQVWCNQNITTASTWTTKPAAPCRSLWVWQPVKLVVGAIKNMNGLLNILLLAIFLSSLGCSADVKENDRLFYLEKTARGIRYSDGNVEVATMDLLVYWGNVVIQEGRDTKAAILFHEDVPLSAVVNLRGIIQKAGLSNIRYFYFGDDRRMMAEIRMDEPAVPYPEK